ncbi:MAG: hypothetical protein QM770_23710 [Tepidisphaeraceae bacterium]
MSRPASAQLTAGQPIANEPAVAAADALYVPDWCKPGATIVYYGGQFSETDDDKKQRLAGLGWTRYDVAAVTPTKVFLARSTYLDNQPNPTTYHSQPPLALSAADINSSTALWASPEALKLLAAGNGPTKVTTSTLKLADGDHDVTVVEYIKDDRADRKHYDNKTGLLLQSMTGTGRLLDGEDGRNPFRRKQSSNDEFRALRQRELPWLNAPAPAWAGVFKQLTFRGQRTQTMQGMPPFVLSVEQTFRVVERGADWCLGELTTQMVPMMAGGMPGQPLPDEKSLLVHGPGSPTVWIAPAVLQNMKEGVIDRDPTLGVEIRFRRSGDAAFLVETGANNSYESTRVFDARDGVLRQYMLVKGDVTFVLELVDRQ